MFLFPRYYDRYIEDENKMKGRIQLPEFKVILNEQVGDYKLKVMETSKGGKNDVELFGVYTDKVSEGVITKEGKLLMFMLTQDEHMDGGTTRKKSVIVDLEHRKLISNEVEIEMEGGEVKRFSIKSSEVRDLEWEGKY